MPDHELKLFGNLNELSPSNYEPFHDSISPIKIVILVSKHAVEPPNYIIGNSLALNAKTVLLLAIKLIAHFVLALAHKEHFINIVSVWQNLVIDLYLSWLERHQDKLYEPKILLIVHAEVRMLLLGVIVDLKCFTVFLQENAVQEMAKELLLDLLRQLNQNHPVILILGYDSLVVFPIIFKIRFYFANKCLR